MGLTLIYLYSIIRGNVFAMLILILFIISQCTAKLIIRDFSLSRNILLCVILCSVPLACMIAAFLMEKCVSNLNNKEFICKAVIVMVAALCIQNTKFIDYFMNVIRQLAIMPDDTLVVCAVKVLNISLKCASIITISTLSLVSLVEIPFVLLTNVFGNTYRASLSFSGVRFAVFFSLIVYCFDFFVDVLATNLLSMPL